MRLLGFLFVALILSGLLVLADYYLPGEFLQRFLDGSFIETFAGLVGFNIAAIIFISGQLLVLEERSGKSSQFLKAKAEIKDNSYFLLGSFVISIILLVLRPDLLAGMSALSNYFYYGITILIVAIFILAIFAIYEILRGVFIISDYNKNIGK